MEAERKDDRDIICEEVFTDLTGGLDDFLKGGQMCILHFTVALSACPTCLSMVGLSPSLFACHADQLQISREQNCRFYEILAPHFRKVCFLYMHAHLTNKIFSGVEQSFMTLVLVMSREIPLLDSLLQTIMYQIDKKGAPYRRL